MAQGAARLSAKPADRSEQGICLSTRLARYFSPPVRQLRLLGPQLPGLLQWEEDSESYEIGDDGEVDIE